MRVAIIGGGPSGAFCALGLLKEQGSLSEPIEVVILDRKIFSACGPRGCNLCAGVISNSLIENLRSFGMSVPRHVVQREIRGYYFENRAGGVHIARDPEATIYTAFRALGPADAGYDQERSFDHYLLDEAQKLGATHLRELVTDVTPPPPGHPWKVWFGNDRSIVADVVVVACGVHTPLLRRLENVIPGYRSPRTIHSCQAEIPLGREVVTESFEDEVKIFALGLPGIKFAALTPKESHVTVTIVGRHVTKDVLKNFLELPPVRKLFPRSWQMPELFCHCHPKVPVTAARHPLMDRLVFVGDAHVSRYLKNGLNSAFETGLLAASVIRATGGEAPGLQRGYLQPCRRRYGYDNLLGRALFRLHGYTERSAVAASALLRAHLSERCLPPTERRPVTEALWNMFTGDRSYFDALMRYLDPAFGSRMVRGIISAVAAR